MILRSSLQQTQPAVATGEAALNRSILNHAIMNCALELLPQSWAGLCGTI